MSILVWPIMIDDIKLLYILKKQTKKTLYILARDALIHLWSVCVIYIYYQTSNISHTRVGDTIVDHSDVVGASPVGTTPTTSSFST